MTHSPPSSHRALCPITHSLLVHIPYLTELQYTQNILWKAVLVQNHIMFTYKCSDRGEAPAMSFMTGVLLIFPIHGCLSASTNLPSHPMP